MNLDRPLFLKEEEAAQYIGMSRSFLRKSRCEGRVGQRTPGPDYHKNGRAVRYSVEDLDRWLAQNRNQLS